jgi:hypothetical protein
MSEQRKYFLEVTSSDLVTITEEKFVKRKSFCLQDPASTEEKFIEFDDMAVALHWMFDNIKVEYIEPFWITHFSTTPYGQKKYFK